MKDVSYNFGAIRDSIARLSSMELIKENASSTLSKYIDRTTSSSNLKKQQLIYKNIQECKPFAKERLAERFINQNLSMFKGSNWDEMMQENKQLRYDLLGAPDTSSIEASKDGKLFEAINTLIESVTNKRFSNFEAEGLAYDMVLEHLTREVIEEEKSEETDDAPNLGNAWEFITKNAVNNFNERYDHLNGTEKEILAILISSDSNKVEYLESVKAESVKLIDRLLDEGEASQHDILMRFKEKIENMKEVSPDVLDDCILECIDLKQSLNELI